MIFDLELWSSRPDCGSAKDLLQLESAYFHSINPGFDVEFVEKLVNGIYYYIHTYLSKAIPDFCLKNISHAIYLNECKILQIAFWETITSFLFW